MVHECEFRHAQATACVSYTAAALARYLGHFRWQPSAMHLYNTSVDDPCSYPALSRGPYDPGVCGKHTTHTCQWELPLLFCCGELRSCAECQASTIHFSYQFAMKFYLGAPATHKCKIGHAQATASGCDTATAVAFSGFLRHVRLQPTTMHLYNLSVDDARYFYSPLSRRAYGPSVRVEPTTRTCLWE